MMSQAVVQFAELVRRALRQGQVSALPVWAWIGDLEQVRNGEMPHLLMEELCPACHQVQPHVLTFLPNWNVFTCLVCDFRHSDQLERLG
jgi:hypothetical protein